MTRRPPRHLPTAALLGAAAGAAGTATMDVIELRRYRKSGGTQRALDWETADGIDKWDNASAPGKFGKLIAEKILGRELQDRWARTSTNVVHWSTGIGWGAQFGVACALAPHHRRALGVLLAPTVWLSGYVILPLAKVYQPIWTYDAKTLAKDFSTHVAYGTVTAGSLALMRSRAVSR